MSNKELERLNGCLRHAVLAMPWENGLFAPTNNTLSNNVNMHKLKDGNPLKGALEDFSTIISAIAAEPTPLAQLIPACPDVLGKVDASKKGAGGIWWSTNNEFPPIVWQVEFPPELQRNLEHQAKGNVNATNSDYEALGFVMAFLVLEQHVSVRHKHIDLCCDNTPTVSWMRRLSA